MTWDKEEKTKIMQHFLETYNESMKEHKEEYEDFKLYLVYEENKLKTVKENYDNTMFNFLEKESELVERNLILEAADCIPGIDVTLFLHLITNEEGEYFVLRNEEIKDEKLIELVEEMKQVMEDNKKEYEDEVPF